MGTWGYGILDNDTAMDVKGAFEEALEGGLSFDEASYQILPTGFSRMERSRQGRGGLTRRGAC